MDNPLQLPGIDTEAGLKNVRGKESLYRKILKTFHATQADFAAQFAAARAAGDQETATRVAHTLKGSAGTIGALQLMAEASTLQYACAKSDAEIEQALAGVLGELNRVLDGIAQLGDA